MNTEKDNKQGAQGKPSLGDLKESFRQQQLAGFARLVGLGHTKGPWIADWAEGHTKHVIQANAKDGNAFNLAVLPGSYPEREANARLIAAAPELLAACEHSLRNIESQIYMLPVKQHGTVEHQSLESWAQLLRAAIAKAHGQ